MGDPGPNSRAPARTGFLKSLQLRGSLSDVICFLAFAMSLAAILQVMTIRQLNASILTRVADLELNGRWGTNQEPFRDTGLINRLASDSAQSLSRLSSHVESILSEMRNGQGRFPHIYRSPPPPPPEPQYPSCFDRCRLHRQQQPSPLEELLRSGNQDHHPTISVPAQTESVPSTIPVTSVVQLVPTPDVAPTSTHTSATESNLAPESTPTSEATPTPPSTDPASISTSTSTEPGGNTASELAASTDQQESAQPEPSTEPAQQQSVTTAAPEPVLLEEHVPLRARRAHGHLQHQHHQLHQLQQPSPDHTFGRFTVSKENAIRAPTPMVISNTSLPPYIYAYLNSDQHLGSGDVQKLVPVNLNAVYKSNRMELDAGSHSIKIPQSGHYLISIGLQIRSAAQGPGDEANLLLMRNGEAFDLMSRALCNQDEQTRYAVSIPLPLQAGDTIGFSIYFTGASVIVRAPYRPMPFGSCNFLFIEWLHE